jgi:Squalene-hopene cyclase C-terminal domain
MLTTVKRVVTHRVSDLITRLRLPAARAEQLSDSRGLATDDPGIDKAIEEGIAWLSRAQDCSASADGGVARHYSLISGWGPSYAETTGYIVPTLLAYSRAHNEPALAERARRMLDWLVSIQLHSGGFQGGRIGRLSDAAVTFNTGQILLGLAAGAESFGEPYRLAMCKAADWLVDTQDADGCWRKYPTPFAASGEKTYETHVAWGLLEAARVGDNGRYANAALANVRWALRSQKENGWLENCCLTDPTQPLTHTLGYALRGVVEAYRFTRNLVFLQAAWKTADRLLRPLRKDGFLPGRLQSDWTGTVDWVCLTGSVQIASCWLLLYQWTDDVRYRDAAFAINRYVRRTMRTDGPPEIRGAIKGSFPISGRYAPYQYPNWACKFFVDANMLEREVRKAGLGRG